MNVAAAARDSFEKIVTASEHRHERALQEDVLACDHAPDLVYRSLDRAVDGVAAGYGSNLASVTHAASFSGDRRDAFQGTSVSSGPHVRLVGASCELAAGRQASGDRREVGLAQRTTR